MWKVTTNQKWLHSTKNTFFHLYLKKKHFPSIHLSESGGCWSLSQLFSFKDKLKLLSFPLTHEAQRDDGSRDHRESALDFWSTSDHQHSQICGFYKNRFIHLLMDLIYWPPRILQGFMQILRPLCFLYTHSPQWPFLWPFLKWEGYPPSPLPVSDTWTYLSSPKTFSFSWSIDVLLS